MDCATISTIQLVLGRETTMRRIFSILAMAVLALACSTASATSTTISGTNVYYPISFPLSTGQFCFNGACATVTNGVFSGTFTEGTATVTYTGNGGTPVYLTIPSVTISTTTYNWNNFVVSSSASISGMGSPTIPCAAGALYTQLDSIPTPQSWVCQSVGGMFNWVPGQPLNVKPSGRYSGTGAPGFICYAPCQYTQTDAIPNTQSLWLLIAAAQSPSSNWVQQTTAVAGGTPFVVTSGCGTTGAVVGGTMAGSFTAGQTSCVPVITPGFTAPHGFKCGGKDLTTPADTLNQTASSTTTCTLSGTVVNADTILIDITAF